MTDIIELAKKCGATEGLALYYFTLEELQAFYEAAQREQIEKCVAAFKIIHRADILCVAFEEVIRNQLSKEND